MTKRHLHLSGGGTLLVNTDLHGNGDDFRALEAIFRTLHRREPEAHWALLGDLVHAPSPEYRAREPELYDYPDESTFIVERVITLRREFPGRVHFVLGNHDYAHIGGMRTSKFYPDEAAHLESSMSGAQIAAMHALFGEALLAISTGCGVFLSHGSPNATLENLADLDDIEIQPGERSRYHSDVLSSLLFAYGQPGPVTARLLEQLSPGLPEDSAPLTVVVHGHDRSEDGWFIEGDNQLCPVIFGALAGEKRYLLLDLGAEYTSVHELRQGVEIRRLADGIS